MDDTAMDLKIDSILQWCQKMYVDVRYSLNFEYSSTVQR